MTQKIRNHAEEEKRMAKNTDPDWGSTNHQDNYNNYSNYQTSKSIGDKTSAQHWRDNWLGEVGRDDKEPKKER